MTINKRLSVGWPLLHTGKFMEAGQPQSLKTQVNLLLGTKVTGIVSAQPKQRFTELGGPC